MGVRINRTSRAAGAHDNSCKTTAVPCKSRARLTWARRNRRQHYLTVALLADAGVTESDDRLATLTAADSDFSTRVISTSTKITTGMRYRKMSVPTPNQALAMRAFPGAVTGTRRHGGAQHDGSTRTAFGVGRPPPHMVGGNHCALSPTYAATSGVRIQRHRQPQYDCAA